MDDKKLLIAGIDPGVTTAYAVLDINGKILRLKSSKQLELNKLISEIHEIGKVIVVGTDKSKVPGLVDNFATKLGARVISPEHDMQVEEKRRMACDYDFDDVHQSDALASALSAHKSIKTLLDKIDIFVKNNKKQDIANKIIELVVGKRMSIRSAAGMIEQKMEEDKIINNAIAKKKFAEGDFVRLYNKLKSHESEIKILKGYNNRLKKDIARLEMNTVSERKTENLQANDFREKRIKSLEETKKSKDMELERLKKLMKRFNNIISNINDFYVLKKLDNFGINEFVFKNRVLKIKRNDVLLVDNPNIASGSTIELLRNKVSMVVYKNSLSRKMEQELPFVFIDARNLNIDEDRYFGFVEKKSLDTEKGKVNWMKKVIEDYKREKEDMLKS